MRKDLPVEQDRSEQPSPTHSKWTIGVWFRKIRAKSTRTCAIESRIPFFHDFPQVCEKIMLNVNFEYLLLVYYPTNSLPFPKKGVQIHSVSQQRSGNGTSSFGSQFGRLVLLNRKISCSVDVVVICWICQDWIEHVPKKWFAFPNIKVVEKKVKSYPRFVSFDSQSHLHLVDLRGKCRYKYIGHGWYGNCFFINATWLNIQVLARRWPFSGEWSFSDKRRGSSGWRIFAAIQVWEKRCHQYQDLSFIYVPNDAWSWEDNWEIVTVH